jgi:hypothetical protein
MFNKRVILGAVLVAVALLLYLFLFFAGIGYRQQVDNTGKANLEILPADSIPTVDNGLLIITPTVTQPLQPEYEGVGPQKYVKIARTGGVGLRIRQEPGTSGEVVFIANESEVFIVIGGPVEKDGIIWWQLSTPYDETRSGWASADYLALIEEN